MTLSEFVLFFPVPYTAIVGSWKAIQRQSWRKRSSGGISDPRKNAARQSCNRNRQWRLTCLIVTPFAAAFCLPGRSGIVWQYRMIN
jgi:hypothetical protein